MSILTLLYSITPERIHHHADQLFYGPLSDAKKFFMGIDKDMFINVEVETTTRCNGTKNTCPQCPTPQFPRPEAEIGEALFKKIVDDLKEMNFEGRFSPHFYGEPLMDERLPSLMAYVHERLPESKIVVWTNGILLTKTKLEELVESGVHWFMVTQYNGKGLDLMRELNRKQKRRVIYCKMSDKTRLFNRGGLVHPVHTRRLDHCHHPSNAVVIDYQGNVVLCCNDYNSSVVFGNVKKEKLADIWGKEEYKRIRQNARIGVFEEDLCRICSGSEQ